MSGALGRIAALGRLAAWTNDGEPVELGPVRQQAVLAALALRANTPVAAAEVLDWVWGQDAPDSGELVVHTYVYRLRRLVEPGAGRGRYRVLVRDGNGYCLRLAPDQFDVTTFEATAERALHLDAGTDPVTVSDLLTDALSMWRGEPLAGLPGPYLAAHRVRLAERHLAVLQHKLDLDIRLGRAGEVLPDLVALADEHPLNENVAALLMAALAQRGRQNEALRVFIALRRRLVDELGVEPGAELVALQALLLRGADGAPMASRVPATLTPPAQLPRDISGFTGRAAALEETVGVLSAGSQIDGQEPVAVAAISGRPGAGKTTLAVHAAHRACAEFPDGQLYLDLRGADPAPVAPAAALDYFLRAVGVDSRDIPAALDERSGLFRSRLAGKRLLVVLDNARDERQVRPLLPGTAGSAVIITSRRALVALDSVVSVRLDSFTEADSAALLRRLVGAERVDAEPETAARIADFCAHLPLALHIAAGKLVARPHWSLRRLAERLSDERNRLDDLAVADRAVRGSIALSEHLLDAPARRAFPLLGLVDLPVIDASAAAALLGVDRSAAQDVLHELVDSQLLDLAGVGPTGDPRVRFHDLIRLYARERAAETIDARETTASIGRLISHYLTLAGHADRALPVTTAVIITGAAARVPEPDPDLLSWIGGNPVAWFADVERDLAILVEMAGRPGLEPFAWELAVTLSTYALLKSRWELWRQTSQAALRAAHRSGDLRGEACMIATLAKIDLDQGKVTAAVPRLDRAMRLFSRLGDHRGRGRVLKEIAQAAMLRGDLWTALRQIRVARTISESVGDIAMSADQLLAQGEMSVVARQYPEAIGTLSRAVELCRSLVKPRGEAMALWHLAAAQKATGLSADAARNLRAALAILERIGDLRGQACVLRDLGQLLDVADEDHEPARFLHRCLDICVRIGERRFQAQAQYLYGKLELHRGNPGAGASWLRRARDTWADLGDSRGLAETTALLADVESG